MAELTGLASILKGISFLYWALACGALVAVLWKIGPWWGKATGALVVLAVFGYAPGTAFIEHRERQAYAREAWAYFKKKCETEAGEKIYKTVTGVKSVLVVKPLPLATEKDDYDQFWYGDPYSAAITSDRSTSAAVRLVLDWKHRSGKGVQKGLDFIEIKDASEKEFMRIYRPLSNDKLAVRERTDRPVSRFGVAWEDISSPEDRQHWVAGSRLRVLDLSDNSVVAERIGFLIEAGFGSSAGGRRPWASALGIGPTGRSCPPAYDPTDQWFITSVFAQAKE